ncbi:MAG TPA: FAD-dependent oxidoreductase [Acidimicrobiia bacterium]|nr:FAD-dependent oxidoreductase [Acidimicrobiia bacterium]
MRSGPLEVAVIGAGPYGLSIGAHLTQRGVDYRIFGTPMHTWRNHMPEGMWLRSEGFASNLADPGDQWTLARYCIENDLEVGGWGVPVPLEVYSAYGEWFVEKSDVPVEDIRVVWLSTASDGFVLELESGETVRARRVVIAVGLSHFEHIPTELESLPPHLSSHSSSVRAGVGGSSETRLHPGDFAGRRVIIIGAGQSALESAALLHEHGAEAEIVARADSIAWNTPPHPLDRSLWRRIRHPIGGLCTGLGCWLYEHGPQVFHLLPAAERLRRVRTAFGPAGAWWLRERIEGKVTVRFGLHPRDARPHGDGVDVEFEGREGLETLSADHVISATGYRVDLGRLAFLDPGLMSSIRTTDNFPTLDRHFQSSVPGLFFVGSASAAAFGPVVRFVLGARFTARVLERRLA